MPLVKLIRNKKVVVGIIGLGYVGLPTAVAVARAGFKVIGIDIDRQKVKDLNQGKSFISDVSDEELSGIRKKFSATNNWKKIKKCRVIIISVPTPLTKNKTPDTSYIEKAAKQLAKQLAKESLVILESTAYPGTTEELVKPLLPPCYLVFSPERIDPGNKNYKIGDIPKIVGGVNKKSQRLAVIFYKKIVKKVVPVSSVKVAEMAKLLENIFRLVNISMINELKLLADRMEIDLYEVIEAAKTKPYGFMPFYPGPGAGGHCIPLDPFYLSWKARELGFFTHFIELAGEINEVMPHYAVVRITRYLNDRKKSLAGSKILVLGAAYKKDIGDCRNSPALKIIKELLHKKADVSYNDPHVPKIDIDGEKISSTPLTDKLIKTTDCVVISTDHSAYDYQRIVDKAKLVIDLRNAAKNIRKGREKIIL